MMRTEKYVIERALLAESAHLCVIFKAIYEEKLNVEHKLV